jgi:hypothetical protein
MSCIICTTVFKNQGYLKKSFDNINLLKPLFSKIKILVSYDNSGDNSLKELCELKSEGWDIDILFQPQDRFLCNTARAYNIAQARNQLLNHIYTNEELSKYNYFIMADLDNVFTHKIHPEVLNKYLSKTELLNQWDSLCFWNERFYDTWSVSIDDYQDSSWDLIAEPEEKGWDKQNEILKYLKNIVKEMNDNDIDLCKITSCFNGFAIHKLKQFKNIKYTCANILNGRLIIDCEHRNFYKEANNRGLKVMFSKDCLFDKMFDEEYTDKLKY